MQANEWPLEPTNPSPFKQPFLVLCLNSERTTDEWMVDVDGKIDLYIKDASDEEVDQSKNATPLMRALARNLKMRGVLVHRIGTYKGGGGPTHILRNGAFFQRMKFDNRDRIIPTWMDTD